MTTEQPEVNYRFTRPLLYRKQRDAFFNDSRYSFIEASTKCFVAGTLVATISGHKPIESIEPGELVLSYNENRGIFEYKLVLERFMHLRSSFSFNMIKLITKQGVINATTTHEFRFNNQWISAIELAKRAVEKHQGVRGQVLCEQSWQASFNKAQGNKRAACFDETCKGQSWLFKNSILSERQIRYCQSASDSGYGVAEEYALAATGNCKPQRFQSAKQFSQQPRDIKPEGEYTTLLKSGALREINWNNQWECETYGRNSKSNKKGIYSICGASKRLGGKIWGKSCNYSANPVEQLLEAREIKLDDIISYELYSSGDPVYDLSVFGNHNYCITESNILVHNSGKTTAAICWLLEQAVMHGKRGHNYWWVAPIRTQAKIAYDRMKRYCPQGSFTSNESDLFIVLFNGAKIWFKSGDHPDGLYGDDVHAVVIDEASRCKDKSWDAVRTTLTATQGKARLIANVKDRRNWFYLLCRQAQAGNLNTSEYHTINADDAVKAGVIPAKEIEDAKAMLPEAAFLALYYNQPADDGGNPFGLKAIRDIVIEDLSFNDPRAFGWDLAKSVDFTVGIGLDEIGHVCRFERFQKRWDATEAIIVDINGRTPALIDSTGVGDPVVERIQKRLPNIVGFKFSQSSKQQLMEGLAVAIQQKLIRIPDGDIVKELESFEYEFTRTGVKYSCPAGLHDDCVMALALAVKQYLEPQIIPRARWL